ncbi:hypothetical protein BN938_1385 [Mucinivorans hirudinis]|uniref:DNA-binding protein n=1 Tax=Mucinivorans hirudinis TaxID=1433126 RepID=A0A060R815_9BACT|nr:hypothetical protein BN938_1385 [Mucinivorans hirudinis]
MSNFDYQEKRERAEGDELFSVPVKAGKRIYYFDVKATRNDDYYITITESRKRVNEDGSFVIDKHKIHLYKEDFDKFSEGFAEAVNYIKTNKPGFFDAKVEQELF